MQHLPKWFVPTIVAVAGIPFALAGACSANVQLDDLDAGASGQATCAAKAPGAEAPVSAGDAADPCRGDQASKGDRLAG